MANSGECRLSEIQILISSFCQELQLCWILMTYIYGSATGYHGLLIEVISRQWNAAIGACFCNDQNSGSARNCLWHLLTLAVNVATCICIRVFAGFIPDPRKIGGQPPSPHCPPVYTYFTVPNMPIHACCLYLGQRQPVATEFCHQWTSRVEQFTGGSEVCVWPGGVMVRVLARDNKRSPVRLLAISLSGNNLRQVVHTRASVTKNYHLVAVKGWWCHAAGKVTIGLVSYWPCITDLSGLFAYGLTA